jgi:hypothetical protein
MSAVDSPNLMTDSARARSEAKRGADYKSTDSPFAINDHSEKSAKFGPFLINRLAHSSE